MEPRGGPQALEQRPDRLSGRGAQLIQVAALVNRHHQQLAQAAGEHDGDVPAQWAEALLWVPFEQRQSALSPGSQDDPREFFALSRE